MSEFNKWRITCERFVGFIDIMGFKDMVARDTHTAVYKKLKQISNYRKYIPDSQSAKGKTKYILFSDSIILFSKGNSSSDWDSFSNSISVVYQSLLNDCIPFKGAIAYGTFTLDLELSIYFGQPLIDAYLLSNELSFYGISFHHTAEKKVKQEFKKSRKESFIFIDYKSVMDKGTALHSLFRPPDMFFENHNANRIIDSYRFMTSGSLRKYIDNTEMFFNKLTEKKIP